MGGTYQVGERLGTGGMADVYEADHVRLGIRVAIKFLRDSRPSERVLERFQREARRAVAANSENLVGVFDCGELPDGTPYLVMERLFGEDLRSLLERERTLSMRRAVKLAIDACQGLSVVHAAGIVHRDLKPANLFVVKRPSGGELCKILDFGVAKLFDSKATHDGALLGTVRYMAPEQLEDAASVRAVADLYALGAILYESLSGAAVHEGSTLHELMFNIFHHDPRPLQQLCAIPAELESVVMRALSRSAAERPASADEFARALAPFGSIAPSTIRIEDTNDETVSDAVRREARAPAAAPARRWIGLAVLGVAVAFAAGFVTGSGRREPARASVERPLASAPVAAPASEAVTPVIPVAPAPAPAPALGASSNRSVPTPSATSSESAPGGPPRPRSAAAAERRRSITRSPAPPAGSPKPLSERIEPNYGEH